VSAVVFVQQAVQIRQRFAAVPVFVRHRSQIVIHAVLVRQVRVTSFVVLCYIASDGVLRARFLFALRQSHQTQCFNETISDQFQIHNTYTGLNGSPKNYYNDFLKFRNRPRFKRKRENYEKRKLLFFRTRVGYDVVNGTQRYRMILVFFPRLWASYNRRIAIQIRTVVIIMTNRVKYSEKFGTIEENYGESRKTLVGIFYRKIDMPVKEDRGL